MGIKARHYWTREEMETLVRLAAERVPTRRIAGQLRRSVKSVRNKASDLQITLAAHGTQRLLKRLEKRGAAPKGSGYSRAKVRVTVDFDISALTREERFALAARLLDLSPDGEQPVEFPPEYDAVAAARERYKVQLATTGNRGKHGRRGTTLSPEERRARREAAREEGFKAWELELRFRDRVQRWREAEFVRDQME